MTAGLNRSPTGVNVTSHMMGPPHMSRGRTLWFGRAAARAGCVRQVARPMSAALPHTQACTHTLSHTLTHTCTHQFRSPEPHPL